MAAGTSGLPGAGSGAPPAGSPPAAAAPPAAGTGASPTAGQPGSQPGTGAPSATPTGTVDGNDANIAVLRKSHELVSKLGGEQSIQKTSETWTKVTTGYKEMATKLGFTPESFDEAWATDPQDVIQHLHEEAAKAPPDGRQGAPTPVPPEIQKLLDARLQPLENQARQLEATKANQRIDTEYNRLFDANDLFKGKNVPPEVKSGIFNLFADALKYQPKVLQAVLKGDVTGLDAVFQSTITGSVQFINAWSKWMSGSAGQPGTGTPSGQGQPGQGQPPAKIPSLDQMIEGDADATRALPSLRGFRGA